MVDNRLSNKRILIVAGRFPGRRGSPPAKYYEIPCLRRPFVVCAFSDDRGTNKLAHLIIAKWQGNRYQYNSAGTADQKDRADNFGRRSRPDARNRRTACVRLADAEYWIAGGCRTLECGL